MSQIDSAVIDARSIATPVSGVAVEVDPRASDASKQLDNSFVRGIAWTGSIKWIVQMVAWGTTILVARILTPADYGLMTMGMVLLAFITILSESGIGMTVVTVRDISDDQTAQINGAALLFGVASFAIACAAAVPMGWFYKNPALPPVIATLSLTLIITAARVVPGALLQKDLRFQRLAIIDASQALTTSFVTIVLAVLGFRYWSLALGGVLGAIVGSVATVVSRPYRVRMPKWSSLRSVMPFTRNVVLGRLFWYAYQNSDFIVAGKRLGAVALGAYSYAWTLASMPVDKISALLSSVTPPIFAAVQTDKAALKRYFLTVTEGLSVVTFPLTVGIALVASDLVPVVFGTKWMFMIAPLQILAIYATVRTITPTASQVLVVTGDTGYLMYMAGLAAVALPAAFVIGSRWGTIGIAVAWTIAHPIAVALPLNARLFWRLKLRVREYVRALWPAVSGCVLMAVVVNAVRFVSPTEAPAAGRLAVEIVAGAIAYAAYLLVAHKSRVRAFIGLWRQRAG
jgi:O-antigen/teichoic acid export membrane protein